MLADRGPEGSGLILGLSVREIRSAQLKSFSNCGFIDRKKELGEFSHYVDSIGIKISDPNQLAGQLSEEINRRLYWQNGWKKCGNFDFDEPTRGIDVGAKFEIYQWMNRLSGNGKGIIMISSELPEVLGMSDRIIVLKEGEVMGEIANSPQVTQEQLMALAIGSREEIENLNENS